MRKFIYILLTFWGVIIVTPLTVQAETFEVINSYFDLPESDGTVDIQVVDDKYDLTFTDQFGRKYLLKNRGLPEPYKQNKSYKVSYKVTIENNEKTVYLNFEHSDSESFIWRVNDGRYNYHNVVTVTKSYIDHYDGVLNSSPVRSYYIHFNVDVPMDKIYRIDVTYYTRVNLLIGEDDWEKYDSTIYYKDFSTSSDFKSWLLKYISGLPELETIQKSRVSGYEWMALIWADPGVKVGLFPIYMYPNREFRDYRMIKFYYVTDGVYYETDEVNDPGTDYRFDEWQDFIDEVKSIIDLTISKKDTILTVIKVVGVVFVIGVSISLLSIVIKPVGIALTIIFKTVSLPFALLARLFNRS